MTTSIPELPATIADLPFFVRGRFPRADLVGRCEGDRIDWLSGAALVDQARDLSLGLGALGMRRGSRIAILSESRPDWLIVDLAILAAGAVTVPIYPTLSVEQVAFILRDSEATVAVASTEALGRKILDAAPAVPALRDVILMDAADVAAASGGPAVHRISDVAAAGHARITGGWGVAREFQDAAKAVTRSDLATIIYTSGTTGEPKGVMLTHGNLLANLEGVAAVIPLSEADTALSYLPLCHSFERTVSYVYLANGVSMVFAESIDTLARDLLAVRPTVMTGVPRVFEKLHARILARGAEAGGLQARVAAWATRLAGRIGEARSHGGTPRGAARHAPLPRAAARQANKPRGAARQANMPRGWLGLQARLADRLVFQKIRAGLGGRLRLAVSGSAPLSAAIGRFFLGAGLPILEGYGLTETAPVLTIMSPDDIRFGTVGRPIPGVELAIADDGEVLARGPNVMLGYFNRPEETAAALAGGWFHTGDIGKIDDDGYLRITDRKKELIVTSGGKKIAPQPIEMALRAHDCVAEVVLVGEQRHYPSALVIPDLGALARRVGLPTPADRAATEALVRREDARAIVQAAIDDLNTRLAQFERIKRFSLLAATFSVETGELTPTLKVKRRVIEERYRAVIDELYA